MADHDTVVRRGRPAQLPALIAALAAATAAANVADIARGAAREAAARAPSGGHERDAPVSRDKRRGATVVPVGDAARADNDVVDATDEVDAVGVDEAARTAARARARAARAAAAHEQQFGIEATFHL